VLSVRDADAARFGSLADLRGKRVATFAGTIAYEILLRAERDFGVRAVSYEDDVHPYSDLVIGRVDAVLLDNVLAERRQRALKGFTIQPQTVAVGHYIGLLAASNAPLRDAMDNILRGAMRDGTLERILRKWRVWNDDQPSSTRGCCGEPRPADHRLRHFRQRRDDVGVGGDEALSALAVARVGRDHRAVLSVHGARHRVGCADCDGSRVR
jgi:hypothetical protein